MVIFNLTQDEASAEQLEAGVLPRTVFQAIQVKELLTFSKPPMAVDIRDRAEKLAELVDEWCSKVTLLNSGRYVMIGGAPYLMRNLEEALEARGFTPVYSYSEQVIEERALPCGSAERVNVLKHVCFV